MKVTMETSRHERPRPDSQEQKQLVQRSWGRDPGVTWGKEGDEVGEEGEATMGQSSMWIPRALRATGVL